MDGETIVLLMATITLIFSTGYLMKVIRDENKKEKDKKAQH